MLAHVALLSFAPPPSEHEIRLTGLRRLAAIRPPPSAPASTDTPMALRLFSAEQAATLGARCLDGTPAADYIHKGTASTKWYIHHQGGGWCESWDDCLGRSGGDLGSSKGYPATSDLGSGYFSTDPAQNPMMHDPPT